MHGLEGEIFVVDNGSSDGSDVFFRHRFPQVQFIWNAQNTGFAKANNQALQHAKGNFILFLNPDTLVPEDCFQKSLSFQQSHGSNIALGIKMIDGSGRFLKESKRSFPSPLTSFYKLSGLARLFPRSRVFSKYHLGHLDENKNHEVDVLAGAFMLVPHKILAVTGGFDEQFFMYGEDIDLSYRIQKAGFKNIYFSESTIIHFKGESTKKGSLNYVKMFYKAMSIFVKKHYGSGKAGFYSFFIHIAIFLRALMAAASRLFSGRWKERGRYPAGPVKEGQILIAGDPEEFRKVTDMLHLPAVENRIKRIDAGAQSIRNELTRLAANNSSTIIFCEGSLSFKQIIDLLPAVSPAISKHILSQGCHAIIGSNDHNISGTYISGEEPLSAGTP